MFLKKLSKLEQAMKEKGKDVFEKGLPFIETLQAFSNIVDSCFSNELRADYESEILAFKSSYLKLDISVTPKV